MVTAELHPNIHTGHAWLFLLYHDVFDRWDYMPVALPVVVPSIESVPSLISTGSHSDLIFPRSF